MRIKAVWGDFFPTVRPTKPSPGLPKDRGEGYISPVMEKKLFLLDAFALIFRAYYSLIRNPRITSDGRNTNAQFGFTNTLLDLLNREKPSHIAVCFDMEGPTERHLEFEGYKANRQETPEDISLAVPDIKQIIEAFNIPVVGVSGYEADDTIGTLAWQAHDMGYTVYMVTPDKDYGQLVRDGIYIYKPSYQKGDIEIMGPKEVCEKWDIERVDQVVDMLGLMGDAVDNIPGIAGVGEKTAAKLLKEHGTLEKVLENADKIKGALGEKVRAGKDNALMSKRLATIITDVPVTFDESVYERKEMDRAKVQEIFAHLEFRTLSQRVLGILPAGKQQAAVAGSQGDLFGNAAPPATSEKPSVGLFGSVFQQPKPAALSAIGTDGPAPVPVPDASTAVKRAADVPHDYQAVAGEEAIQELLSYLNGFAEISFDTETTGVDANTADLVGMSFSVKPHEAFYVPVPDDRDGALALLGHFRPLFADAGKTWIGQNVKYDFLILKWYGIEPAGDVFDTMLAQYVIEPEGKKGMDLLSIEYLGYEPIHIEELIGKKGKQQGNMRDVPLETIKEYAAEDADITLQLKQVLAPLAVEKNVGGVLAKAENPLVKVLVGMESEGVRVDMDFLRAYSLELEREARRYEENVFEQAGVRFNLASPKQLGEVLFEKLKLDPKAKTTKTGQYATGEDVLAKLAHQHKIVDDILGFRELTKLKSTYVDALPALVNPRTGRIHTSYAQAVAVTGRLSSNNPNLQNIPIRTEKGREIRKAFVPRDADHVLMSADYSQIELRIVAAISGDPNMCQAFRLGKDIHTATAAKVFGVDEKDVTKEQRYKAKSVNFGIIYGQGTFGLAENLGIRNSEAKAIIDNYKKEFSGINAYMTETVAKAKELGYVETLLGRKRWLRDIGSSNFTVRGFAERNAVNSPIQGTAADMIKLAMIEIHGRLRQSGLASKMILQVHDELVFDVRKDEVETLKPLVLHAMRSALPLPNGVPVEAEVGIGGNWLEAH